MNTTIPDRDYWAASKSWWQEDLDWWAQFPTDTEGRTEGIALAERQITIAERLISAAEVPILILPSVVTIAV